MSETPTSKTAFAAGIEPLPRWPSAFRTRLLHTLRNYSSDLGQFFEYFSPPGARAPAPDEIITALDLREWLAGLYESGLSVTSIRRKLASVRSLFKFLLLREGTACGRMPPGSCGRPKLPQRVPVVPTAEQTNTLVEGVAADRFDRPHPERDLLLFELLLRLWDAHQRVFRA